jgi:predicted nuclease of predicted toxin-antitoxin system
MKVLLDECVTRYLKRDFTGHEVLTVEEAGFKGLKNGRLLQAASGQYEVLVTVDQNLQYQQNLKNLAVAIIVLKARRSTYPLLKLLMPQVLETLEQIKPGEIIVLS